jgi:hypothetical protein
MQISHIVRPRGGPVSCWVMHLPVRISTSFAVLFALGLSAATPILAQGGGNGQSSSSQQPTVQSPEGQQTSYGVYVPVDPLAKVRYDNRYDLSLGLAYDHMKAGPTLLQGSNLGGLDVNGSFWLSRNWGIEATDRTYVGTSGAGTSSGPTGGNAQNNIKGPFVSQYFFTAGPEWLGPHNKHGALIAHAMVGGVYGDFQKDLLGEPPSTVAFYNNQLALAAIIGGHMDLNRSDHWVLRITPDAMMTHYSINYAPYTSQFDVNFAISVGLEYKFTQIKRSTRKENWVSGW